MTSAESVPRVRSVTLPKAGSTQAENEDASAATPAQGRFAVADGATESSYSGRWARLLTRAWVEGSDLRDPAAIGLVASDWSAHVPSAADLPWYVAEKAAAGAHATFAGLVLASGGEFRIACVGDSCVFWQHAGEVRMFPPMAPTEFGMTPRLINSRAPDVASWSSIDGIWSAGDLFILATDAVAAYLSRRCIEEGAQLDSVLSIGRRPFIRRRELKRLRASGQIRNDDLTYVAVTCR